MIRVEGIGKRYRLGQGIRHDTLRDAIMHCIQHRRGSRDDVEGRAQEHFWALEDVSFDVATGEVIGIIGSNGAGKSTLLKILSRITPPTEGRIRLRGRVASLLEVGTGFHPELSGRENIYMNGAILGMTRQEIKSKFDEIVAFSEVEKFLDTPVKRYSSGMYVRLAFAVAAHLEPEVLLVDEVLAVGDSVFQKKCLGKIAEVATGGRTVLFVSHNMAAVQQLTSRSILLADGKLVADAETADVVATYLASGNQRTAAENLSTNDPRFCIESICFNKAAQEPGFDKPMRFDLSFSLERQFESISIGLGIYNSLGVRLLTSRSVVDDLEAGKLELSIRIPDHHLPPGDYSLALGIFRGPESIYFAENVLNFSLSDVGVSDPLLQPYLAKQRDQIGAFIPGIWEKV
jgi:lipopolysaccharide transport system ATP-binding protein